MSGSNLVIYNLLFQKSSLKNTFTMKTQNIPYNPTKEHEQYSMVCPLSSNQRVMSACIQVLILDLWLLIPWNSEKNSM